MSTRVVMVVKCDQCGKEEASRTVSARPDGWWRLLEEGTHGRSVDLCPDCGEKKLGNVAEA